MNICYNVTATTKGNPQVYKDKMKTALQKFSMECMIIPKKTALAWTMKKDELCRISVIEGSQVGDVNMWNLNNPKEHFYSGSEVSKEFIPKTTASIDKSSLFRVYNQVPLIVPEVNLSTDKEFNTKNIIANPNCTVIPLAIEFIMNTMKVSWF